MRDSVDQILQEMVARMRIPRATYRLQFNRDFTFSDAQALVPYLDDLGISDCYVSPLFMPCSEKSHGYDICDHNRFNPDVGSAIEFDHFSATLGSQGMGIILDVVPNHMGISGDRNQWWIDVLENGPSSVFSGYFDIEWHPVKPELENKVLLPILEDQYGKVLESGKFQLTIEDGAFFIYYYKTKLPVTPRSYSRILGYPLESLTERLGKDHEDLHELKSILTAISYLPDRTELGPEKLEERSREKEIIKRRIGALYQKSPEIHAAFDDALKAYNGRVGDPHSFELLDGLLSDQVYRPAFWRVASDEVNYRRFFDINELAAIRMESPEVFQKTHQLIFHLLEEEKVTGLRIDHPDGLWNPSDYFARLQKVYVAEKIRRTSKGEPTDADLDPSIANWFNSRFDAPTKPIPPWPLFVIAEKILGEEESLPWDWAVFGTTGYDFLNAVNNIFIEPNHSKIFDRIYSHFMGTTLRFPDLVNSSKKMIMLISLSSEVNTLSHGLERISEKNRRYRDFTLYSLTFAIREVIASLPVYRTYIQAPEIIPEHAATYIEAAVEGAKKRNPRTAEAIFDFIRDTLLLRNILEFGEEDRKKLLTFVMKFQQITSPVMAKGVEDTACYIYNRLVSLNEVGGHPDRFGISTAEFHLQNEGRQKNWPHSLLATSTHDTKRSEDVRARINVLSEIPGEWRAALNRWRRLNDSKKILVDGEPAPDRNDEYFLYQTLVGTWPLELESSDDFDHFQNRIASYMLKATRESKVHTSWVNPNEEYDAAVTNFIQRVMDKTRKNRFLEDIRSFQRPVSYWGQFNSLSQVLLKLTSPGIPDIYQGTELWDFSLVDPDNRQAVDHKKRQALLADLKMQAHESKDNLLPFARDLLANCPDGRIKLYVIFQTLNFRRAHPLLFERGSYLPLEATGEKRKHLCAFSRVLPGQAIVVVTPRLIVQLTAGIEQPPIGPMVWKDTWLALPTELQDRAYRNLFTGEQLSIEGNGSLLGLSLASMLRHFPVVLLEQISQ